VFEGPSQCEPDQQQQQHSGYAALGPAAVACGVVSLGSVTTSLCIAASMFSRVLQKSVETYMGPLEAFHGGACVFSAT